jgi:hypothetical protein
MYFRLNANSLWAFVIRKFARKADRCLKGNECCKNQEFQIEFLSFGLFIGEFNRTISVNFLIELSLRRIQTATSEGVSPFTHPSFSSSN